MFTLRPYQEEAVLRGVASLKGNKPPGIIVAATGCLSGETIININNRKNGKKMLLKDVYERWNGLSKRPQYNWEFKNDVKIRSMIDGKISLNGIKDVLYSGKKETIKLSFENGNNLILTPEHLIFTKNGWIRADKCLGEFIANDINPRATKIVIEYKKYYDSHVELSDNHKYARKLLDKRTNKMLNVIEVHRAIYEAHINGFKDYKEYKEALKTSSNFKFIDPKIYDIHHKDFDHKNNNIDNLECLTKKEHANKHIEQNKKNFNQGIIEYIECVSIEENRIIDTYDICCKDPNNNFVANGFIVHNSGKSIIIANIAKQLDGDVLVLQPTKEILEQNYNKYTSYGFEASIYSASFNKKEIGKCTFATIGSIYKKPELFKNIKYLIQDECQNYSSKNADGMYNKFFKAIGNPPTIGLTATPYRLVNFYHKEGYELFYTGKLMMLNRIYPFFFKNIIHKTECKELIDAGFLSPLSYFDASRDFNWDDIPLNSTGCDFKADALEKYSMSKNRIAAVLEAIMLNPDRKYFLVFCSSIRQAMAILEILIEQKINCNIVTSDTPTKERAQMLKDFKDGKIKVMLNVQVLTVGFDFPELDCIVLARPTMSLALYYQMVGRGLRIHPDKKNCLVIDCAGNVSKLGRVETIKIEKEPDGFKDRVVTEVGEITGKPLFSFKASLLSQKKLF